MRRPALVASTLALCASALVGFATPSAFAAEKRPSSSKQKQERLYKWVDENGVTHYGDSVPPQYAKTEQAVLNEKGVEVGRVHAEMTAEQQAIESARTKGIELQKQRDQFLLTNFASVAEIEAQRDLQVEQIQSQSTAAEQFVDTLNTRLTGLQARAQTFKPYNTAANARAMPDDLAADLVRTLNELRTQKNLVNTKRTEIANVEKQYQADIDRFTLLRSGSAR